MGSHIIFIRIIDKPDLYLMFLFIENYSFGEEHIIAEKVKVSTEELTALATDKGCFSRITQCFTSAKLIWTIWQSKQQHLWSLICSRTHSGAAKTALSLIIKTCNVFEKHKLGVGLQPSCVFHHFLPGEEGSAVLTPDEAIPGTCFPASPGQKARCNGKRMEWPVCNRFRQPRSWLPSSISSSPKEKPGRCLRSFEKILSRISKKKETVWECVCLCVSRFWPVFSWLTVWCWLSSLFPSCKITIKPKT